MEDVRRRLADSPIGTLVPISGHDGRFGQDYEAEAFVPHDLPDRITLPGPVSVTVGEAMSELGRLDGAAALIPNPQLIVRIATRREAVGTSALEGTYADLTEVLAAEVVPDEEESAHVPARVREVMNYTRAAEAAYRWITEHPITLNLLCSLQAEIVRGTAGDGPTAGALRETQVFIGARDEPVGAARFIPPPPGDQLRAACERWIRWLTAPEPARAIPLLARVAMAHYQFETLHPFTDGNGRLGRLVAVLQLLREGALRAPVLSISAWLKDHDEEYRDHLLAVSVTGDWAPWIGFFARAVLEESRRGHDRITRLLALRDELSDTVRTELPRARLALEITESLIAYPILSVADTQRRFGRTNQANRNAINRLVDLGILEPFDEAPYRRLYWNRRVLQTIAG